MQNKETWLIVTNVIGKLKKELELDELPCEGIFVNLGRNQSQTEGDRYSPANAHGHINLQLSKKAVQSSSK